MPVPVLFRNRIRILSPIPALNPEGRVVNIFKVKMEGRNASQNESIMSEMFLAIYRGQRSKVERILNMMDINAKYSIWDRTALFMAVLFQKTIILETLLSFGADPNADHDILHIAVTHGNIDLVQVLINYGVVIDRPLPISRKTALFIAVQENQRQITSLLLNRGADPSRSSMMGPQSLLHTSIINQNVEMALELLERIRPRDTDNGEDFWNSALHLAVANGHVEVVRQIISKGGNVNKMGSVPKTGQQYFTSPLQRAIKRRDIAVIQLLLENGARSVDTIEGRTLHYAVNMRCEEIVTLILSYRAADIDEYDSHGFTALHVAVLSGHLDMAKLCLQNNANVNAQCFPDNDRQRRQLNSIFFATLAKNVGMVELLLSNGAEPNFMYECVDRCCLFGLVDLVIFQEEYELAILFLKYGGYINILTSPREEHHFLKLQAVKLTAQVVFEQPLLLKTMAWKNYIVINSQDIQREFYETCLKELSSMRDQKVFNNITFYDFMIKSANKTAMYAKNESLEDGFLKTEIARIFPIYSKELTLKYAKARYRGTLLKIAEELYFSWMSLPTICIKEILENLSDSDLQNLIRAFRSHNETGELELYIKFRRE